MECSQEDGESIFDCTECKTAAEKLGIDFSGDEDTDIYPKGCYAYELSSVYCNRNRVGYKRSNSSPICKVVVGGNVIFYLAHLSYFNLN